VATHDNNGGGSMMRRRCWYTLLSSIIILTGLWVSVAHSQSSPNYRIECAVLDGGGGLRSSTSYILSHSIGQVVGAVATASSPHYKKSNAIFSKDGVFLCALRLLTPLHYGELIQQRAQAGDQRRDHRVAAGPNANIVKHFIIST
jgi:hypothetical protein